MGYYVRITNSNVFIPKVKQEAAYKALCALNTADSLKGGGSYGPPPEGGPSVCLKRWFSWMDANYPEKCKDLKEVLEEVGFDVELSEAGDILSLGYDSKTGDEEHFLNALAPFVANGSFIEWQGEDGEKWRHEFDGHKIRTRTARTVWM
jgi:hypothetical protein